MANFKGFKQVSLSTYLATSEENRKDYLWFVRQFSGETVVGSSIYFGNRLYADLTGEVEDPRVANIIASLGDLVDENGEWVGFLPIEEHEILGNSGITSTTDALSALEAAILNISGRLGEVEEVVDSLSGIPAEIETIENALATKANAADVETLSGSVETVASDLQTLSGSVESVASDVQEIAGTIETIDATVSALSAVVEEKADADNVYTKSETYNKEEIDAKVAGAFKFKGDAESISADKTTIVVDGEDVVASEDNVGFVYQIGDVEYASNGVEWVELGFNIDLSQYATKDYVNSAISEEAAAREELAANVELVESALTEEITAREALGEVVEDLEERATITAQTYSDAAAIQNLRLGQIVYVLNDETESGVTYGSGAYIYTQGGLRKLDSTTPSTSTTLEERVEILENTVGSEQFSGNTLTEAVAALQVEHTVTGDDVEE